MIFVFLFGTENPSPKFLFPDVVVYDMKLTHERGRCYKNLRTGKLSHITRDDKYSDPPKGQTKYSRVQ